MLLPTKIAIWGLLLATLPLSCARREAPNASQRAQAVSPAVSPSPAPPAPPEPRRLSVMFFGAPTANGPHHDPITRYRVLKKAVGTAGIDLTYLEDPSAAFTPEVLASFDAVLMYGNWNQHEPMKRAQLTALLRYVDDGGGFVPVHCASACFGGSPLFVKLVGARFAHHGGEEFQVENVAPEHEILRGLDGYEAWDETYVHDQHSDDRTILQARAGEPWTWTREQGKGRVFYTASGHDHRVWDLPQFHELLRRGIRWAVGEHKAALLDGYGLPERKTEAVSLPGYRERKEITRAQAPLSPAESQKLAQVPVGMTLQLFASEPDIVNPIHVSWDIRGRAFVIETIDYPNNLQANNLGHDRITICEDADGDGVADRFTRFAERLSIPTSLCFADGGVLCTNGSEMLFLRDTDGDDVADERNVLFDGFSMGDTHAGVSNLRYGMDGWVYATIGYSGFRGEVGGERHEFAQGLFRFLPDGKRLEFLQNTTNNTWGLGFTSAGDVVGSTANGNPSFYLTFPRAAYELAGVEQPRTPAADDNPMFFPMSQDIRQVDQFDRYTSGAGHAVYTAARFPSEYHDRVAFVCGPTGKLVGRFELERRGGGFSARLSPNNLYASADAWSSPVCAEVGPDGAVWICDWYNLIIQHNPTPSKASAGIDAKTGVGNAYETPLRDKQHGRIWRVFPTGSPDDASPTLDPADAGTLLAGLDHANMLWRMHAQRLLVELGDDAVDGELEARVRAGGVAAPHALQVLAELSLLSPSMLQTALASPSVSLRRAALRHANVDDVKRRYVRDGAIDASGRELAEVLVAFSRAAADPDIGRAICGAAKADEQLFAERAMRDAWTMAAQRQAASVLAAARADGVDPASEEARPNLLPNAAFEDVVDGKPSGWPLANHYSGARPGRITVRSSEQGRGGSRCLEVRCDEFTDFGVAVTVPVRQGVRYRLSGWVRTVGAVAARGGPGMMLNVHGGPHTRGLTGDNDWTELSLEFEAWSSEQMIHCLFGGYGGAKGVAYYDDVSLVELGDSLTLAGALRALADRDAGGGAVSGQPVAREFEVDAEVHARGAEVFRMTCVACHGVDGRGAPATFPPLRGSDWLTGDVALPTKIVLHGLTGEVTVGGKRYDSVMAPLGPTLDDQQIADVLTYVRQSWGNDAAPVTREQVAQLRAQHEDRYQFWTAEELGR